MPTQRYSSMLRYLWAFPASAVGLTVALIARAVGGEWRVVEGVLEVAGGAVGRAIAGLPPSLRFSAITLGHVVIGVDQRTLTECRLHEHVHVRQYERWGVFFFPLYIGSSVWQMVNGRNPYWHNRFEIEAYREECRAASKRAQTIR